MKRTERKILLFQPGDKAAKPTLPATLLAIAAPLHKAGFKVEVLDSRTRDYSERDLENVLFIGITSYTGSQLTHALKFAGFVRKKRPDLLLVWGGIHVSLLPRQSAEHELVDVVIKGEGEATLLELAERIEARRSFKGVKGIVFTDKKARKIIETPNREWIDLNKLPFYPYEIIDLEHYAKDTVSLQSSRGCPHNCNFCFNRNYNKQSWRYKNPKKAVDEMECAIKKTGIRFVAFNDDNFFVNKKRVEEIAKEIIRRKLNIEWSGMCRADYIARWDLSFMKLLKRSGLKRLGIGIESGSNRVLEIVHKGTTREINMAAIKNCGRGKILPICSFMVGVPGETKEDTLKTLDFIDEMVKVNPDAKINGIFVFTPYPGTQLYDVAVKQGFKEHKTLDGWAESYFSETGQNPWYSEEYAKYLETIFNISTKLFDSRPKFGLSPKQLFRFAAKMFLLASARARWRLKFFDYAFEWTFFERCWKGKR